MSNEAVEIKMLERAITIAELWVFEDEDDRIAHYSMLKAARLQLSRQQSAQRDSSAGKWVEWKGGNCPVPPKTLVEYKLQDYGDKVSDDEAGELEWGHGVAGCIDIVAYRIPNAKDTAQSTGAGVEEAEAEAQKWKSYYDSLNVHSKDQAAQLDILKRDLAQANIELVRVRKKYQKLIGGGWRTIESAPRDEIIIGWCPDEDCPIQKMILVEFQMIYPLPKDRPREKTHSWSFRQNDIKGKAVTPTHWRATYPSPPASTGERGE